MESSILNEQRTIQAKSDVFWTMQLTRDILRDIWQKTTSYCRGSNKMQTILIGCHRKVQSLDKSQKSQVLFRELHKLNKQWVRWYLKLQDYNFIL